ncbi:MAG TPA: YraN family protein [Dehalococcoidia bacterium]|nr:YraN family protein [Dehalococcoidia bacterium]
MAEQGKGYRQRLGQRGEDLAAEYLEERGYKVIDRNVRRREGEIDLIATHQKTLVIVEVKLRSSAQFGGAVEALTSAKQRRLRELAVGYSVDHPELPSDVRIDLIAIDLAADGEVGEVQHVVSAIEG